MDQPVLPGFNQALETQGFAILQDALDQRTVEALIQTVQPVLDSPAVSHRQRQTFAVRNLLNVMPVLREVVESVAIRRYVEPILSQEAQVTRGMFFDKPPAANWKVSWHQDVTITVKEKKETPGFTNWTLKAGIAHVQPPIHVLENILTLRIHLDDADESNGALKVIPGSHRQGRLIEHEILGLIQEQKSFTCCVKRGGILAMKPLLLHASSPGKNPGHRRVIHLEFSETKLPNNLEWFGS